MSDDNPDIARFFNTPRIIVPLPDIGAVAPGQPLGARTPRPEPDSSGGNPEQSGNIPYVMRSKKFGSTDPDDDTAALGLDEANPDTWFRYDPPYKKTVAVSGVSIANPTVITTAAHGVPSDIGGTFTVVLAGLSVTNTGDNINGTHQATYISATTFSIPLNVTAVSDVVGTCTILTSGVTIDAEPRIYNNGSGSYYLFTRQKKFDRAGELYYISGETKSDLFV